MNTINIQSWGEFEIELQRLTQRKNYEGINYSESSDFYFRGQSNADWPLNTTLERVMNSNKIDMLNYYSLIGHAKSRIETFTGNTWKLREIQEYIEWLNKSDDWLGQLDNDELAYMAYLRHHGYPSPLLDWTMSPYVAAYFAFRDVARNAESVAIFVYSEMPEYSKDIQISGPNITVQTNDIRSDRRHFLQQSSYTICTVKEKIKTYYCSHEEVFSRESTRSDLLWKIILPATERRNVLKTLDTYNINSYSLFQSEDSILETVFLRDYVRKIF